MGVKFPVPRFPLPSKLRIGCLIAGKQVIPLRVFLSLDSCPLRRVGINILCDSKTLFAHAQRLLGSQQVIGSQRLSVRAGGSLFGFAAVTDHGRTDQQDGFI